MQTATRADLRGCLPHLAVVCELLLHLSHQRQQRGGRLQG